MILAGQNADPNNVGLSPTGPTALPGAQPASPVGTDLNSLSGINSAQAGTLDGQRAAAIAALARGGSPVPSALAGGGPATAASLPQGPPGYFGSTGATGGVDPAMIGRTFPTPPAKPLGLRGPAGAQGPLANVPAADAQPVSQSLPAGSAGPPGATAASNPYQRFIQIAMPNAPAGGRGSSSTPQMMSALNLAGLFGRGQPAAAPGPLASAPVQPVQQGGAPWSYGPLQRGMGWPGPAQGPLTQGQSANSPYYLPGPSRYMISPLTGDVTPY